MKHFLPLLAWFSIGSTFTLAQNVIQVHIDHGGLHCPYLSPRFESNFTSLEEVDSVMVDTKNSIGYLYLAHDQALSDEEISAIIVHKVGYPKPEIKAIIRNED